MSQLGSHSADIEMWLDCGPYGRVVLSRITPKSVVAKAPPRDVPPCLADLIVVVDGHRMQNRVNVTSGFSKGRLAALIQLVGDVAPF
jgi:hypothetical protein